MATHRHIPDEPDQFENFACTVAYLCEEAERIGLVRTRAMLERIYAQLPSEMATLRAGQLAQHRPSPQSQSAGLHPELSIFHSRLVDLFALYARAHTGKYRRCAVARFFDIEVRQLLLLAAQTPLLGTDLDALVEMTRNTAQRLAEQQAVAGVLPVIEDASVKMEIDRLVPIGYGSD